MHDSYSREANGEINESDAYKRRRDAYESAEAEAIGDFAVPFARAIGGAIAAANFSNGKDLHRVCAQAEEYSRLLIGLLFELAGDGALERSPKWREIKRTIEKYPL